VTLVHRHVPPATTDVGGCEPPGGTARRLPTVAVVAAAAGLAVLVGSDGSLAWRIVRVFAVVAAGVLAARSRNGARAWRTVTVSFLGTVAFVAGVGIGVPHAAAGAWVTGAAGLSALVSGAVLLAAVVADSWRATGRWGRVGTVLAVLALAQWVLFPVSVAVFATNRAPTPLPARTPADVGLEHRNVTLTTSDGVALSAWYVPSTNGAALVLLHGSGSTRADVLDHAAVLSAGGYGVLVLDARGHGASEGHAMDLGWYGDADIAAAVDHLVAMSDVTGRIGAVGMSMGGEAAVGAAAAVPELAAVVAEGATGRRGADWLPLEPAGIGRWSSGAFYAVQDGAASVLSGADPPTDLRSAVVAAAPTPMLLIAAGEVPREGVAGWRLHEAAPDRVELWEVPDAEHTGGLTTDAVGWTSRVGAFLDRALLHESRDG
jgi:uncharacterized protein